MFVCMQQALMNKWSENWLRPITEFFERTPSCVTCRAYSLVSSIEWITDTFTRRSTSSSIFYAGLRPRRHYSYIVDVIRFTTKCSVTSRSPYDVSIFRDSFIVQEKRFYFCFSFRSFSFAHRLPTRRLADSPTSDHMGSDAPLHDKQEDGERTMAAEAVESTQKTNTRKRSRFGWCRAARWIVQKSNEWKLLTIIGVFIHCVRASWACVRADWQ